MCEYFNPRCKWYRTPDCALCDECAPARRKCKLCGSESDDEICTDCLEGLAERYEALLIPIRHIYECDQDRADELIMEGRDYLYALGRYRRKR